jgi:membrane-associated phospholipid phosphatase
MRIAEWLQIVFVCLFALAAWFRPLALLRRVKISALAALVVTTLMAARFAGRLLPPSYLSVIRDWLSVAFFQIPFWQSGQFYVTPNKRLQERLTTFDRNFFQMVLRRRAGSRWGIGFSLYTEFAYLMCYLIVPLGVAVLYVAGMRYCVDHYWTVVLLAAYICYAVSPFVQALPPRTLVDDKTLGIPPSKVRELNRWILRHASIQVITFPSAHVAASVAASLVLFELVPWMGLVFAWVAVSIAVATVVGGYHYVADVLSGILVALLIFFIARWLC